MHDAMSSVHFTHFSTQKTREKEESVLFNFIVNSQDNTPPTAEKENMNIVLFFYWSNDTESVNRRKI